MFVIECSADLRSRRKRFQSAPVIKSFSLAMMLSVAAFAPLSEAKAQEASENVTLPAKTVQHAIAFLSNGGTHAEADALSSEMLTAARNDIARQQQAAKAPSKPPGGSDAKAAAAPATP